MPQRLGEI
ncbi:hypothetical protein D041_0913A, partial [Vibrio parahaemolyticus EKP-008]